MARGRRYRVAAVATLAAGSVLVPLTAGSAHAQACAGRPSGEHGMATGRILLVYGPSILLEAGFAGRGEGGFAASAVAGTGSVRHFGAGAEWELVDSGGPSVCPFVEGDLYGSESTAVVGVGTGLSFGDPLESILYLRLGYRAGWIPGLDLWGGLSHVTGEIGGRAWIAGVGGGGTFSEDGRFDRFVVFVGPVFR